MTVTLLSQAPDLSTLKPRHVQKDTALLVSPPLAGHEGPILVTFMFVKRSGIAVEYPDIIIHAASRQEGQPNIYCQLDSGIFFPNQQLPQDEEERQEIVTELRLIPRDSGAVEGIYMAIADCTALHPDKEFMDDQQESDQEFFANPSDETELGEVQQAALRHLETVFEQSPKMNGHMDESQ